MGETIAMTKIVTGSGFGLAPTRTAQRNAVEKMLVDVLGQYGYQEVTLPLYEYADVLKTLTHNFHDEDAISFIDRTSGKSLVLRPDFTPQVCRMVAAHYKDISLPVRMFYRGSVFRNVIIDQGAKAEKYHIGCELYGTKELEGDRELFLCLKAALSCISLNFSLLVGDAAFLSRVAVLLGEKAPIYTEILKNKRLADLPGFTDGIKNSELKTLLKKLPMSFGGIKELDELAKLTSFDSVLLERMAYVRTLFTEAIKYGLDEESLIFDPSEVRGLDYYTGINFEVIHKGGTVIAGGGRYNSLMDKLGLSLPACGMALHLSDMEALAGLDTALLPPDWIVVGAHNTAKAEELRREGFRVVQLFSETELEAYEHKESVKVYK